MAMIPVIEVVAAAKAYQGVFAIEDINFDVHAGEVHALLGENGAGKSTLTKAIAGVVALTRGKILVDGVHHDLASPSEALEAGIAMVFQETSLVPTMTVAQNIYLGDEKAFNRLRGLYIQAQQFLQSMNFSVDPTLPVGMLGAAQRQMVEIARAVHHKAKVIIFDEPTATLTPEEKQHFFDLIVSLKKAGVAIIFISHALEEALDHADRITILRDGRHVVTEAAAKLDRATVVQAMVGRELSEKLYGAAGERVPRNRGQRILSVENLSMQNIVKNNSFSVYGGQVTGVFGLVGSGRTETAKIISGVLKRDMFHGGEVFLNGRAVRYRVPKQAIADGIVYVTEDRKVEGFFETMTISENIYLGDLAASGPGAMLLSKSRGDALAQEWSEKLNIRATGSNPKVIELSGGNQQKVVVAKSLVQNPKLVIFDEPTRGVDVGAIQEIHELINSLADSGLAVVVISSYLPEVLNISDRILVCRQGRIVEEFSSQEATEEKIMYAAVH